MKLIFMGTPDFAVPSLETVVDAGYEIAAVYTQPDKPKGRGLEMTPPPVKKRALELGLTVRQPVSLKGEDVQREIAELQADCIVVVAYGKLLPKAVLECVPYGCVNVHSSLLPKYRGAAPINWAVINGEKYSGVTTMKLDEGMDTGDILLQRETEIQPEENAGELHDRLSVMGAELLLETLAGLRENSITPTKQDDSKSSHAPMLDKTLCAVDWSMTAQQVHDKIRGLTPWPVAVCMVGGKRVKLHRARVWDMELGRQYECGEVVMTEPLVVACGEGAVEIVEMQGEGGKRMSAADYLRGHPLPQGETIK